MELGLNQLRELFQRIKALTQRHRAVRMRILVDRKSELDDLDDVLLVQSCDVTERINDGVRGTVTCVSTIADLPLDDFMGLPVETAARHRPRQVAADSRADRQGDPGLFR